MLPNQFSESATIQIINSLGQLVYQNQLPSSLEVDISNLSNGIYFVKVSDGNQSTTKKVSKTAR
jgi:hypothetical protein